MKVLVKPILNNLLNSKRPAKRLAFLCNMALVKVLNEEFSSFQDNKKLGIILAVTIMNKCYL